jgi:hypothetical protein
MGALSVRYSNMELLFDRNAKSFIPSITMAGQVLQSDGEEDMICSAFDANNAGEVNNEPVSSVHIPVTILSRCIYLSLNGDGAHVYLTLRSTPKVIIISLINSNISFI